MAELRPFPVVLAPHNPLWAARAGHETVRLQSSLGPTLLSVHHIGSTAIPGIDAKPIIDLMPIVSSLDPFDAIAPAIESLGYRLWGECGIVGRRYCTLDNVQSGTREVQLHIFASGDPHIVRHLALRDYMRAHPQEALAYQSEKHRARALHPTSSHAYSDAKSDWVRAAEQRALAWWAATQSTSPTRA